MSGGDRLLAILLRAYPQRVRARFGTGMLHAFRADLAQARSRGWIAVAAFWFTTIADTARFALAERRQGFTMSRMFTIDWRDAVRSLRAAPLVTGSAVVSLALGIGGVTALFSILNSLVLKPLPVRDPSALVLLDEGEWTNPIWESLRDTSTPVTAGMFAWGNDSFNLSSTTQSDAVEGMYVSGAMFEVLGVPPAAGRVITASDDVRGGGPGGPVAVISHAFWQRRFGGAPGAIGQTLLIERVPFVIVGVTPQGFFGPDVGRSFDVAIPLGTEPLIRKDNSSLDQRLNWWMNIMARLSPGDTPARATARLRAIQPRIRAATEPQDVPPAMRAEYLSTPLTFVAAPQGRSPLRQTYQHPLAVVMAVVGAVLLIACANIANLLLARASSRRHELSLRLALGASRSRLARQLFAESLLLGGAGAVLGLALARVGSQLVVAQLSTFTNTVKLDLALDWRVLGFVTAVSVAAAMIFGMAPALSVSRVAPNDVLKEEGRGGSAGHRSRLRHASVVLQVALSLVLIVGAGLFTRTFIALATRDGGFDSRGVLLAYVNVQRNPARDQGRLDLFTQLRDAAASTPGAGAAGISLTTPTGRAGWNTVVEVQNSTLTRRQRLSWVNAVSPGWFAALGLRLTAGRDFDRRDRSGASPVAIVNRAFQRRYLGEGAAIGRQFTTVVVERESYEVVGVVEDSVYRSLRAEMEPTMYIPVGQWREPAANVTLVVRASNGPPQALVRGIGAAVERIDATAVLTFRTLDDQLAASLTQERLVASLAAFFGALALLLAGLGLYGVTAYAVASRRAEIGIRIALGASADGVVRLVLARVAWLVGGGVALGGALSVWASRYIGSLLYGLEPRDPATFVSAALILVAVAACAAWLPARRASRIDPMRVLRNG